MADAEAARLLTRWKPAKKEPTLISNHGRIVRHIKPILGRMTVIAVTTDDVGAVHRSNRSNTLAREQLGGCSNVYRR